MWLTSRLSSLSWKAAENFAKYASYSPTPLSLKQLSAFGEEKDIVKSTQFLRLELPVRVANILQEIHLLPKKLLDTPSASIVTSWYEESLSDLIEFVNVGTSDKECQSFLEFIDKLFVRHTDVVETMAHGVMEMQEAHGSDVLTNNQLQYFLDRFYMMRISIRMLISQHLLVFGPEFNKHQRFVGCIDRHCNVVDILNDAFKDAKLLCDHHYAESPDMEVELGNAENGLIELVFVPSHLYHILFELLKNAMRAVVERGRTEPNDEFPPIKILIIDGEENVSIKVSDKGGGFPLSFSDLLFRYTFTTAGSKKGVVRDTGSSYAAIAGYGYGLPLSRLYARYLQGDLRLAGMEGYGTDAFVFLTRQEAKADELLPVFNRTSARRYGIASIPVCDWSNKSYLLH